MQEWRIDRPHKILRLVLVQLRKCPQLFRRWGFSFTTEGGSLGSTVGELGQDMVRDVNITFVGHTLVLSIRWKNVKVS